MKEYCRINPTGILYYEFNQRYFIINMSNNNKITYLIGIPVLISIMVMSCKDPWNEYTRLNDDTVTKNLMEVISGEPNLSAFNELLVRTGWDEILVLPQLYTVWAPTNDALNNLEESYLTDSAKLKQLVDHHIAYSRYSYINSDQETQKIKMYSGKNLMLDFQHMKIDYASLNEPADIPAVNGMLHVIDDVLIPKDNIWDLIENNSLCPLQTGYINSLTGE